MPHPKCRTDRSQRSTWRGRRREALTPRARRGRPDDVVRCHDAACASGPARPQDEDHAGGEPSSLRATGGDQGVEDVFDGVRDRRLAHSRPMRPGPRSRLSPQVWGGRWGVPGRRTVDSTDGRTRARGPRPSDERGRRRAPGHGAASRTSPWRRPARPVGRRVARSRGARSSASTCRCPTPRSMTTGTRPSVSTHRVAASPHRACRLDQSRWSNAGGTCGRPIDPRARCRQGCLERLSGRLDGSVHRSPGVKHTTCRWRRHRRGPLRGLA
jgi:hypothetical protein